MIEKTRLGLVALLLGLAAIGSACAMVDDGGYQMSDIDDFELLLSTRNLQFPLEEYNIAGSNGGPADGRLRALQADVEHLLVGECMAEYDLGGMYGVEVEYRQRLIEENVETLQEIKDWIDQAIDMYTEILANG